MMKSIYLYLLSFCMVVALATGCEHFLTPSLDQQKTSDNAVHNASDLQNIIKGSLDWLINGSIYGQSWIVSPSVMSDNAYSNANSGRLINQDKINFTVNSGYVSGVWGSFYHVIAQANLALQSAEKLNSSPEVDNIRGQAFVLRALAHMNLLIAFGQQYVEGGDASLGIPYITTYDKGNKYPARDPISDVWNKIGEDFNDGISLMDKSTFEPNTMNYWAAKALQTRYYLYTKQYDKVISTAQEIINSGNFSITPTSNYVSDWASGIPESLFELDFTSSDQLGNGSIAYRYLDTEYGDVSVTDDLYNAYSSGDIRLKLYSKDTTDNTPFYRMTGKFTHPQGLDNIPVIRYAEVILNYAEALARNPATQPEALEQLNKITSNRNVPAYSAGILENVLKERRLELAMEGQRFYDLARTGKDISMGDKNSFRSEVIPSGDYRFALPIPNGEIQANSNIKQNDGYR